MSDAILGPLVVLLVAALAVSPVVAVAWLDGGLRERGDYVE